MSYMKSVVLLLTVVALVSFANQREAAIEAAESLGYIDFSEITPEGAEIALELVEEFIQDKELVLIPGDAEPLYGYGYGDKQIAYMVICHREGKIRNMDEYQRALDTQYQLWVEYDYYRDIAREQGLEDTRALIPEENDRKRREVGRLLERMFLMIVAKVNGEYHLVQASSLGSSQITHYRRPEFETFGNPTDYYLTVSYLPRPTIEEIDYNVHFSIYPIFEDEEGNRTRPFDNLYPEQKKPQYHQDKLPIYPGIVSG
ncbi:hypothetical protein K8R78_07490 [bacterium]|nr:hypothetical protein [bacterium]